MADPKIVIDTDGIARDIGAYFKDVIRMICELIVKEARLAMPLAGNSDAGKPEWIEQVYNDFDIIAIEIANNAVTGTVGLPYDQVTDLRNFIIASVIDTGHTRIPVTRPGEMTYDNDMYLRQSGATKVMELPQFYYEGSDFMKHTREMLELQFDTRIKKAWDDMPMDIITRHINIK